MKTLHRFLPPAAILLALASVSCSPVMVWATTERASWSYVDRSWGGIEIGNPTLEDGRVAIPFRLFVHEMKDVNSGICLRRKTGRVESDRVIIRLYRSLCEDSPRSKASKAEDKEVVYLDKLSPGKYTVVYDDAGAGFPKIGEIEVR